MAEEPIICLLLSDSTNDLWHELFKLITVIWDVQDALQQKYPGEIDNNRAMRLWRAINKVTRVTREFKK